MFHTTCPRGVFALDWAQTETDGLPGAGTEALHVGAEWRYHGAALRMDRAGNVLDLPLPTRMAGLNRRAADIAARLSGREAPMRTGSDAAVPPEAPMDGFVLTDGQTRFEARVLRGTGGRPRAVVLTPALPPPGRALWVVASRVAPSGTAPAPMLPGCIGADTLIDTPQGPRPADSLRAGDHVLTVDAGPQPLLRVHQQSYSADILRRRPALRPLRISPGALHGIAPTETLRLAPNQRVLLTGPRAMALFGCHEVLARARDLMDDRGIRADFAPHGVTYVHLLLDRHQLLLAQGAVIDSFHPLHADPVTYAALCADVPDAAAYGAPARRWLEPGEAALMAA